MCTKIFFQIILLVSFTGCKGQTGSGTVFAEPVSIQRFDKALFSLIETGDSTGQQWLLNEYPDMLDVIGKGILNMQSVETPSYFDKLINFFSEPTLKGLYRDAIETYDNITDIEQRLGDGFYYLKTYFPELQIPRVYMHVSGLNQNVLVGDNLLSLSIDKYIGKEYPLYMEFFYDYQREKMQRSHVVPDYLSGFLLSEYPFAGKENVLLERMVYEGKIKYLVSHALPYTNPQELLGYTDEQYSWCMEHEKDIWKAIIERKHLYTPDHITTNKYFEDIPNSFIATDAPGNLGTWIGWQIVSNYMKETKSTPQMLMQQTDAQQILTQSKYKPF